MLIDEIDKRKQTQEPWRKAFICVWCFLMIIVCALSLYFRTDGIKKRQYVTEFLESISESAVVYVNGQSVDNPDDVIVQLLTLRKRQPHGSHPVEKLEVVVTNGEKQLKLVLGTDSEYNTEYWVYLVDKFRKVKEFPDNDLIGTIDRKESIQGRL